LQDICFEKGSVRRLISQIVHRQAVVMGYGDALFMLTLFYFGFISASACWSCF
jgi:hypothetical protein